MTDPANMTAPEPPRQFTDEPAPADTPSAEDTAPAEALRERQAVADAGPHHGDKRAAVIVYTEDPAGYEDLANVPQRTDAIFGGEVDDPVASAKHYRKRNAEAGSKDYENGSWVEPQVYHEDPYARDGWVMDERR